MTDPTQPTVLVIDDEEAILSSLRRLLRREFNVLTASSGAAGYDLLCAHEVQVVLSDQRMPGMSGAEFLACAKSRYPDAIRMMLTGYAELESVIAAINSGQISRYLVKPWNPDELVAAVREAVEKYHLIVQNRELLGDLQAANAELEQRVAARTAELTAANGHLRDLNRMKDEVLAITSHDLRSPLGTIYGAADALILDAEVPGEELPQETRLEFLYGIRDAAEHQLALVTDILDRAKLETGGLTMETQELLVSTVAEESLQGFRYNARAKHIDLRLEVTAGQPFIEADRLKLYQLCNNLIGNALKFTPEGGTVMVRVEPEGAGVFLSVTDTGLGIAPDELPYLFDKFRQTRTRSTRGEAGTGLGLAIARQIVEMHGGTIAVTSELGHGTCFRVSLPAQRVRTMVKVAEPFASCVS